MASPSLSAAARTLVKSTCAVMSCSPGRCSHGGAEKEYGPFSGPAIVCLVNVVSVPPAWEGGVELIRFVPVVNQHDESACEALGGVADPVDRAEVDLHAPPGLERDAETLEIRCQRRRGERTFDEHECTAVRLPALGVDVDVHLAQAIFAHDDLVHGKRIEQLVRDEHAFELLGQRRRRGRQTLGGVAERCRLGGAGIGARFDQVEAQATVERRIAPSDGAEDVGGEPAVAGAGFDEIESGFGLGIWDLAAIWDSVWDVSNAAISAICASSSSPKIGPTSTLVKKSPARPDRWAARA